MFGETKALSVNEITSSGMTLPLQRSPINKNGTWFGIVQQIWGSPVKVQQIFQNSVNLGQSSQDFKKSLNVQNNLTQDSFITTWGIRMSKVFKNPM